MIVHRDGRVIEQRPQRLAVHAPVPPEPAQFEHGGRDVEARHQRRAPGGPEPRRRDRQRHPQHPLVVQVPLQHQGVVAHHLAVVGGEHDDRVVRDADLLEVVEDPADLGVDELDHPVGGGERLTDQTGVIDTERHDPERSVGAGTDRPDVRRGVVEGVAERVGRGHVLGPVAIEPLPRRGQRMVGVGEGHPRHPRSVLRRRLVDEGQRALGDERRAVQLGRVGRAVDLPPPGGPAVPGAVGPHRVDDVVA